MNKILLTLISIVVVILVAALVVPSFIDWSQYKDQIKTQVKSATGYQLELNGSLKAALLPYPHVMAHEISVDSADAVGPYAFKGSAKEVSVSVALFPLINGNIQVNDVRLIDPRVELVQQNNVTSSGASQATSADNAIDGADSSRSQRNIQMDGVHLENAYISYKPLDGETIIVEIPELDLAAETLKGPFDANGSVVFQKETYEFDVQTGALDDASPMSVNADVQSKFLNVTYNGVIDTANDSMAAQGEISAVVNSLAKFGVPVDGELVARGLLSADKNAATLKNAKVTFADATADMGFDIQGLDNDQLKTIQANVVFKDDINLDGFLVNMSSGKGAEARAESTPNKDSDGAQNTFSAYSYLPETITLPASIALDANIKIPNIVYKGQSVQGVDVNASLKNGQVTAKTSVAKLPDTGSANVNMALRGESMSRNGASGSVTLANPSLDLNGGLNIASIKALASDWLGLVDASVFDNPSVPNRVQGDFKGSVRGGQVSVASSQLLAGQYNMKNVSAQYLNGAKPEIRLAVKDLDGANVNVSGYLGDAKQLNVDVSHSNTVKAIQIVKPEFKSMPALEQPFDFKALVVMGDNKIDVQNMKAKLGSIATEGQVSVDTLSSKPDIKANLAFDRLDTQVLMGGEKSKGQATGQVSKSSASTNAQTGTLTPWTKTAIDTEWLRSMNVDIQAKANTLVHGTWTINNPVLDIAMEDGELNIRDVTGELFGGAMQANAVVTSRAVNEPLNVQGNVKAKSVDLNKLVQSAMNQTKDRVLGQASFDMALSTSGSSSHALINNLNGDGNITTSELTLIGLDLAKLSEAISDESLTDLASAVQATTNGGRTVFEPIDQKLTISEGTMPIDNFTLKNSTATLSSNGYVSFARWMMDLKNVIQITEPEKLPELVVNLKGPLNNPSKDVANDLIKSYVMGKYGAKINEKVDKLLGDKLKDTPVKGLINNFLGVPSNDNTTQRNNSENPGGGTSGSPDTSSKDTGAQQSPEEQVIRGLFNAFGK